MVIIEILLFIGVVICVLGGIISWFGDAELAMVLIVIGALLIFGPSLIIYAAGTTIS